MQTYLQLVPRSISFRLFRRKNASFQNTARLANGIHTGHAARLTREALGMVLFVDSVIPAACCLPSN